MSGKQTMLRIEEENLNYVDALVVRMGAGNNRNGAVNMMIAAYRERDEVGRLLAYNERLITELEELRKKVVNLAMGREEKPKYIYNADELSDCHGCNRCMYTWNTNNPYCPICGQPATHVNKDLLERRDSVE